MATRATKKTAKAPLQIWTVGHSTRSSEEFNQILTAHDIQALVDVRTFPGSRRYPQFNKGALADTLKQHGIDYSHMPELGGRRSAKKDSKNTAWKNASFRGYADYMETTEFEDGIVRLLEVATQQRTSIMCAEAVWWRCHRSLISDFLKARGVEVTHILSEAKDQPHPFTSAARIVNGELSYAGLFEGS